MAHVRGLVAGTHCNVTIIAISGGLPSNPLFKADIETEEQSMIINFCDFRNIYMNDVKLHLTNACIFLYSYVF